MDFLGRNGERRVGVPNGASPKAARKGGTATLVACALPNQLVGLGLAVTLEFLGPLAGALLSSRSTSSAVCAVLAGAGVVAITLPKPSTDYVGIARGLIAACSWAAYFLLNRTVGRRIRGVQGTAAATSVSAVLAAVVPYLADLIALRRVPANVFGVLMSINPVFAALVGALVLHEHLGAAQWCGIGLIVVANAGALLFRGRGGS